ncbi:MAG TPA: bifunctional DNA-formamidopyrimidine glycosylase/DNA-(apurinic or apyrimidinic site) lyase [Candidatus Sulfotelmatobacter sp.]|nr:bifunctional DNA-formamidopyrimidine glycosylase/DNA-(apurinic or apyrimidinic site) lyase [Candidatus Sulfotelmatobacter sp.]
MPELPEVETVCRGLRGKLEGRVLRRVEARRKDLRIPLPPDLSKRTTGRRVLAIRRRAKYILIDLDDGTTMIVHLGMSGRILMTQGRPNAIGTHDHVLIETEDDVHLRLNDARRFGLVTLCASARLAEHALFRHLGPEPLDDAFDGATLAAALAGRRTPIKAALLDQQTVVGVGNIYACEALFHAGLSPRRLAATVKAERADRLVEAIKSVLLKAIAAGGSSLRDHVQPSGELGYFQHQWAVYGREGEPCPGCDCKAKIRRMVQSNRSTFYCAKRQR